MPSSYSHGFFSWQRKGEHWYNDEFLVTSLYRGKKESETVRVRERENHTAILKHVSGGGFRIVISPLNLLTSPCATTQWPSRQYIYMSASLRGHGRAYKDGVCVCMKGKDREM